MELSLEDLFADPPPKVTDNAVSSDGTTCLKNVQDTLTEFNKGRCSSQDGKNTEVEVDNEKKWKGYHVPRLEDILGVLPSHTNQKARRGFDGYFEETNDEKSNRIFNSNKRDLNEIKGIGETFKEQFRQKNPKHEFRRPGHCHGETLKRKPEENGNDSTDMKFELTATENISQGIAQPVSKRKKTGNYQRKLHTKCRVGAKEIQKFVGEQGEGDCDFFGEMSNSSVERTQIFGVNNSETWNNGNNIFSQVASRNIIKKTGKQKSKKKKKNRKGKDRMGEMKESVMYDNDGFVYNDDNILPPRKDSIPHKWPVCKQTGRTETETKSKNELNDKNSNGKINEGNGNDVQNSVLDSILQEASHFAGRGKEKDSIVGEIVVKDLSSVSGSKNKPSEKEEGSEEASHFAGRVKEKDIIVGEIVVKNATSVSSSKNISSEKEGGKKEASHFDGRVIEKDSIVGEVVVKNATSVSQNKTKSPENEEGNEGGCMKDSYSGPEVSVVKWYEEVSQRKPMLNIDEMKIDGEFSIRGKDEKANIYKNQKVNDRSDKYDGKQNNKDDDDDDDDNGGDDDINDDDDIDDNDVGKNINDDGNNNVTKLCINASNVQNHKTQIPTTRDHNGSLLSNVTDLPVDLTIVGQATKESLSGRRKRGGRKKKSKKKERCKENKLKVDTKEAKARCKYFLEGKCNKGAACLFLHEGVPQRRELCRYYVTDSCLADKCIFMHNEFPCKFFHGFSKCANGSTCKYSHEPLNEETRKLLDELLARDAALKTEITSKPSEQTNDVPLEQFSTDKDTDQIPLSLYSSLI